MGCTGCLVWFIVIVYVISPVDFMPGWIDDVLFVLFVFLAARYGKDSSDSSSIDSSGDSYTSSYDDEQDEDSEDDDDY